MPEELTSLLHRQTEGNPLFMIAVLEHMLEAGLVEHDQGGWRLRCSASEVAVQVPETLRQMIGAQIDAAERARSSAFWRSPRSPA